MNFYLYGEELTKSAVAEQGSMENAIAIKQPWFDKDNQGAADSN